MQIAVITGASKGIGLETARQLAALGHYVILTGRNEASLADAAASIPNSVSHVLDVNQDASVNAFFEWI